MTGPVLKNFRNLKSDQNYFSSTEQVFLEIFPSSVCTYFLSSLSTIGLIIHYNIQFDFNMRSEFLLTAPLKHLNLSLVFNGTDGIQNESGEWIFYVGSRLEVKCEAERSETRRLFWDAACREFDSNHSVDCFDSPRLSSPVVLFCSIILIL